MMRFLTIRYLRGIGWRYVRPDGIEHRCHFCNGGIVLLTGRCFWCGRRER